MKDENGKWYCGRCRSTVHDKNSGTRNYNWDNCRQCQEATGQVESLTKGIWKEDMQKVTV